MNLLNLVVQGNLVRDANYSFFGEKKRAVINFVIAVNLPSKRKQQQEQQEQGKVIYLECSYWFNQEAENEENKQKDFLIKTLKKGAGVVIHSEYIEPKTYVDTKTGVIYESIAVNVKKIVPTSLEKKNNEPIGIPTETISDVFPKKPNIEDDVPF